MEIKNKEHEALSEDLLSKQTALNTTASELQQLRDMSAHQRKRIAEMLTNLLKDLGEFGVAIGGDENLKVPQINLLLNHFYLYLFFTLLLF